MADEHWGSARDDTGMSSPWPVLEASSSTVGPNPRAWITPERIADPWPTPSSRGAHIASRNPPRSRMCLSFSPSYHDGPSRRCIQLGRITALRRLECTDGIGGSAMGGDRRMFDLAVNVPGRTSYAARHCSGCS